MPRCNRIVTQMSTEWGTGCANPEASVSEPRVMVLPSPRSSPVTEGHPKVLGDQMTVCGKGLSCELVCPAKKPGQHCTFTLLEFAELVDASFNVAPERSEVGVPVGLV